jgi:hypothetical protein
MKTMPPTLIRRGRARLSFRHLMTLTTLGASLWLANPALAGQAKPQPLFDSEKPLNLRLVGPISDLQLQEGDDESWIPGKLYLLGATGAAEKEFEIGLNVRGNFRRSSNACNFPPFWLNLKKEEVKDTVFAHQDKLKVVVHCQKRKASYEKYIFKEYLVYKTYNLITDASFRVRLAKIEYVETSGWIKPKPTTHPAFLIEHHSSVADRLGGKEFEGQAALPSLFADEALFRAELFQFLIGNTDFSLFAGADDCCHNAKVIQIKAGPGGYIPVPYDFDLSGIVNAPYAVTNPSLEIDSVTERLFRGTACPPEVLDATIRHFLSKRDAILKLWATTELLEERDRREAVAYLEEFFAIISNPTAVQKQIKSRMPSKERMDEFLKKKYPDAFEAKR